jgi:hypothetical protein
VITVVGRQTMPANELGRLAAFMEANPKARPDIGYPGRKLRLVYLLDRTEEKGSAQAFEGEAAIQRFRECLDR